MRISICPVKRDASLPERKSAGHRGALLERLCVRAMADLLTDWRGVDYVNQAVAVTDDGIGGGCCGSGLGCTG